MSEQAIETRVSRLESGHAELQALQAEHAAWRREMEEAQRDFWRRDEALERKLDRFADEARARSEELDRRFRESREEFDRSLRESREEFDRSLRESREESDRSLRESREESDRRMNELGQATRELGKQIGGLGQKFGSCTEGMALPSMERRLAERFGTTTFAARTRVRIGRDELEVDAIAYSDGEAGTVCVVDVKSHLRDEGIDQLLRSLEKFPRFFPEHRGKRLIGVLAAVDAGRKVEERVLREGLVLARIRDDVFELQIPDGYEPRAFPNPPAAPVA
ncbi:MAG: DUF3782 domain-containing protein [Candidatus Rokuibacteriota bacterium]